MVTFLITTAFALTCPSGDTACEDANELRDLLNVVAGEGTFQDGKTPDRLSTEKLRNKLETIYEVAAEGECTITGWTAVGIDGEELNGTWTDATGEGGGSFTGTLDRSNKEWMGSYDGTREGDVGTDYGLYNNQFDVAADRGRSGFSMGNFIRVVGSTVVGFTVDGNCDQPGFDRPPTWVFDHPTTFAGDLYQGTDQFPACPVQDLCEASAGPADSSTCEACIQSACASDSYCCTVSWDETCTDIVLGNVCPGYCD